MMATHTIQILRATGMSDLGEGYVIKAMEDDTPIYAICETLDDVFRLLLWHYEGRRPGGKYETDMGIVVVARNAAEAERYGLSYRRA